MRPSPALLVFVQGWESCELVAYLDSGNPPVPTIGWGHTRGVRMGDTCTQATADEWFADEMGEYAAELEAYLTRTPEQNQFDALLSLGYNAGIAPPRGIGRAGIVQLFNGGDDRQCADRFLAWNKDGGRVVHGLTKRRAAERDVYLYADYTGRP